MNNKKTILLLLLIFTAISSGCNFSVATEESSGGEENLDIDTIVEQTLTALENQIQEIPTPIEEVPTITAMPTMEVPEQTQAAVVPTSAYNQTGCLIASSISETIPDDTIFAEGESFNKTWTVINSGSCDWTTNFQLVFLNGEQLGGISPTYLSSNVPAGTIIDLTLALTAPTTAGTFISNWELQTEDGIMIAYFWVKIIVE